MILSFVRFRFIIISCTETFPMYGNLSERLYYNQSQLEGKAAHESIDNQRYSNHKNILQGIDVYSNEYKLCGKIDVFDTQKGLLTERKKHIQTVYDGYVFQLYAQCFCLREMGYTVNKIRFYSSDNNIVYNVPLPEKDESMTERFATTMHAMQTFDIDSFIPKNEQKCATCIYNDFCDRPLAQKKYNGGF